MSTSYFPLDQIHQLVVKALVAHKTSIANARQVADALVAAEIDGLSGHGLSRLPSYTLQASSGKVDGCATPSASSVSTATGQGFPGRPDDLRREGLCSQRRQG